MVADWIMRWPYKPRLNVGSIPRHPMALSLLQVIPTISGTNMLSGNGLKLWRDTVVVISQSAAQKFNIKSRLAKVVQHDGNLTTVELLQADEIGTRIDLHPKSLHVVVSYP